MPDAQPTTAPLVTHTPASRAALADIFADAAIRDYLEEHRRNTREQSDAFQATIRRGAETVSGRAR